MINQFYIDYIKAIENPDRVGWNGKVWIAPQYKGYDKNQRGYGIDIVKNDSAKRLTQNRPGQWLTEGEADKLMKEHLLYVYGAAQKHIEGFNNLSNKRKAALLGMLYRGDSVNKNKHIIDINEPDDNKFFESISNYYKSKGLNNRAKNSSNFFSQYQTNFLIPMKWELWRPPMKFKNGGQVRKMQTASGGPIHYSRTMTTDNLSKAANYVGELVLKGLGAFGKIMTAPFVQLGPTSATIYKSKKLLAKERAIELKSEELLGKAMTWVSPLNYGVALATGNGLDARKGEEEVASWSPAWLALGRASELYVGPKAVKGVKSAPRVVVNTAAKAGVKPAKVAVVAREIKLGIKLNTKNGRIEVTENYFNSPDKWYRITETPEKYGIMELGKNVTTHDAPKTLGTINGWRSSVLNAKVTKGPEGFIKKPSKIELNVRRKNGQAHGNTSLAAKGKLWGGTTSGSRLFPEGVIEGQAPSIINYGIDRTNFVLTPWELVPNGGRVGFHTGEMPMSNLGWFLKTKNGTYTYEPVIPEKRISYQPKLLLDPSTSLAFFERKPSRLTEAERAGIPKGERFTPKWHIANYPGYLLKGLMKDSLLEKQLSKNGTININLLNTYFNKASQIEKEIANKILTEKFTGLKTIDYNLFKKAVLDELITYSTKPQMRYSTYGMDRLGFNPIKEPDGTGGIIEYVPGVRTNTFTFESPRILQGSDKHYDYGTLGHSRTYTTSKEPKILHVMESLSDWSQEGIAKTNEAYRQKLINNPESYNKRINSLLRMNEELEDWENMVRTGINHAGIKLQPYEIQQIQQEFIPNLRKNILNIKSKLEGNPLALHLSNNYLQRQLQENLKYAAENGLTKMRYPTSETAAKIEGYTRLSPSWELIEVLEKKYNRPEGYVDLGARENFDFESLPEKEALELSKRFKTYEKWDESQLAKDFWKEFNNIGEYYPQHQTILKKYSDFPKLFGKLFKDLNVRTVTDAKGNTWYEVDVPKRYLNREWLFKQGGKMNVIEQFKQGDSLQSTPKELKYNNNYYGIMEKVAEQNYKNWGFPNIDYALLHALNDNTYNYKGYYNKYPNGKGNAIYHWTDEFKTVYHPTFSKESKYSGKKSLYNPKGIKGGSWLFGKFFIPSKDLLMEYFKKGGGIHIKEKNKGKFTSYCGGKVTNECILRGKNSSNPAIRKRATFAANARKWKHKEGGKIDFLSLGGWVKNTFNNVSSFLGSDTGKSVLSIGSGLIGLGKGISNSGKIADAANEAEEAINALESADRLKSFAEKYAAILLEKLSKPDIDVNGSPIHTNGVNVTNEAYNLAVNTFNFDNSKYNQMRLLIKEQALQVLNENSSSMIGSVGGLIDSIGGIAGSLLNKKSTAPKTSLVITGNPDSSKQVITTNSGMSGTVDDWRKAILG